jgi:isocitrate/isopropylmalate dehydrogenase
MNNRSNMIKVAVVGGDGIGPEVTAQVASSAKLGSLPGETSL